MSSAGSVTAWIDGLKAGDHAAAQRLWERYYEQLVRLARKKLTGARRRAADEEDVVQSALDSFYRSAAQGRFPQLRDRDNLWPLLIVITERKAFDLLQHEKRRKRGRGAVRGESVFLGTGSPSASEPGIGQIEGREPTPEDAAQVAEECERLLERLGDDELRRMALWKMEGFTNKEIAAKLGCALATVERRLRLIRRIWEKEVEK